MTSLIIYADILFAVNFIMDLLCLYVSARVLDVHIKTVRLFCAASAGALYGVLSRCISLYEPICFIAVWGAMTVLCYGYRNALFFVKALVMTCFVGMLLGGVMSFLQRIIYESRIFADTDKGVDLLLFVILFFAVLAIIMLALALLRAYGGEKTRSCIISFGEKEIKVRLLVDTGNLLRDPYTDKSVVIVRAQALDDLFGKNGIHREYDSGSAIDQRLHFVPCVTLSGKMLLPVIGAAKIFSVGKNGKRSELFASVASDVTGQGDYAGCDGVMPLIP